MISIENSRIVIDNYRLGECEKLESYLSVWDKVTFSYTFCAYVYDEENKKLIIPGGFNIEKIKEFFPREKIVDNTTENKYREINFSLKYPTRNSLQNQAINFLLKEKMKQKFLCLETGGGKTYCSIHYVFRTKKLPITFVDQESIMNQWKERIMFFTDIKEEEIFLISGRDSIDKIMKMKKSDLKKYKWFIAIHRTMNNFYNEDPYNITKLFDKLQIGVKLYDEAHVEFKNILYMDCFTNCETIYITATPSRSDPSERKVYNNMFWDVPKFKGSGEKYHNVIMYTYNSEPSSSEEMSCMSKYGFDIVKWGSKYLTDDDKHYNIFLDVIKYLLEFVTKNNRHKIAILLPNLKLCEKIHKDIQGHISDYSIGQFHSKIKDKDEQLEKDIIITTDKSFGKAIDVKNLSIVINAVPLSSSTKVLQMLGRLREIPGKEVFYIDLTDEGFTQQRKQAVIRKKVFKDKCKKLYNIKNK